MASEGFHLTPIGGGRALLEPTLGLDIGQAAHLIEDILRRLQEGGICRLYYDLSNFPVIDQGYFAWLNGLAGACKITNVRMICINMQPTAAFALASLANLSPQFDSALDVERHDKN